ncbi:hypothetical protein D3C83_306850 [compost metagenome]
MTTVLLSTGSTLITGATLLAFWARVGAVGFFATNRSQLYLMSPEFMTRLLVGGLGSNFWFGRTLKV